MLHGIYPLMMRFKLSACNSGHVSCPDDLQMLASNHVATYRYSVQSVPPSMVLPGFPTVSGSGA